MSAFARTMWMLTVMLLVLLPVLSFIYWYHVFMDGLLPVDGDNFIIGVYHSTVTAIIVAPFAIGLMKFCLRSCDPATGVVALRMHRPYRRATELSASRRRQFIRTIVVNFIFGGCAIGLAVLAMTEIDTAWPWYEHIWSGYMLAWALWFLGLGAALVSHSSVKGR